MIERTLNVLFLCTGNSARSILAEALMTRLGKPRYRGYSAGSHPKPVPHPLALEKLAEEGHATEELRSKSWDEFAHSDAPPIDLVITVCDNAAGESCPVWPGKPIVAHWSHEDPAAFRGPPEKSRERFELVYRELERKIDALIRLDAGALGAQAFAEEVRRIGQD